MIIYTDITDGETGCFYFRRGVNAAGTQGPSASMKICSAFRQITHVESADTGEEMYGAAP